MRAIVRHVIPRLAAALAGLAAAAAPLCGGDARPELRVLDDEIITATTIAENNTTPMWAVGAPLVVRHDGAVWTSLAMHDPGAEPYCNTHWELWRKRATGPWAKVREGDPASEREPCPLILSDAGSLAVSIHPRLLSRDVDSSGRKTAFCQPALAVFTPEWMEDKFRLLLPDFGRPAEFSEHSYRGIGADPGNSQFLLFVIDREDNYHAALHDAGTGWRPLSAPVFPIRACYPNVALRQRAAHFLAIGDIKEPNPAWREEKARVLKRKWDYVFRRLFYAWAPDLASGSFEEPLEVDSVDDTAGWMFNLDLLIDSRGRAHLLWVRHTIQFDFLRDRFFPGQPMTESIMHAVIEQGRVVTKGEVLSRDLETGPRGHSSGRLHELPDGRIVAVLVAGDPAKGDDDASLWLQPIGMRGGRDGEIVRVALARPPPKGMFFTNTPRGGSRPDHHLDVLCAEPGDGVVNLRYIHVFIP